MLYSRCLYVIMLSADNDKRRQLPISRKQIDIYIRHACNLQKCELLKIVIDSGYILCLANINPEVTVRNFIDNLKNWTSSWITTIGNSNSDSKSDYWDDDTYIRAISPEDNAASISVMDNIPAEYDKDTIVKNLGLVSLSNERLHSYYHIILITSRGRVLLPLKYRFLLAEITKEVSCDLGIEINETAAMRNHVHILCRIPINMRISGMIQELKSRLLDSMHKDSHFKKMEGWSEDTIVYTVNINRIKEEEHQILTQDTIHRHSSAPNEMSFIYQKLQITYLCSLY